MLPNWVEKGMGNFGPTVLSLQETYMQKSKTFQMHRTSLPILLLPMHPQSITKIKLVIVDQY